jgi:hypothetical protein
MRDRLRRRGGVLRLHERAVEAVFQPVAVRDDGPDEQGADRHAILELLDDGAKTP